MLQKLLNDNQTSLKTRLNLTVTLIVTIFIFSIFQIISLSNAEKTVNFDIKKEKITLFGIFSTPSKFHRRNLIRSTYLQLVDDTNIDYKFVVGRPNNREELELLQFENKKFNDLMILDIEENMNDGKTFHYFQTVYYKFKQNKYKFVMKVDDDTFLHLPNFEKKFSTLPTTGLYFGRYWGSVKHRNGFMTGMGYALSWDLVEHIAEEVPLAGKSIIGQEDGLVPSWIGEKAVNTISEDLEYYDSPKSNEDWAKNYTDGTLLIHRLKRDDWFLNASTHFLKDYLDL
ncbi:hypothetical protein HK099_002863 [Clydaea vesicula]|uniref:Hexosyltransferase n=1 Tax=Clydaea vesicula TaxID=447962 RepID=A0AAD5XRU9_9FUNG|nr:hypothetical protein HK099_002863 [Clydaea vesicula]KAJ3376917.1 hypothetical protein HDU92_008812 [Lobulomyces angularis]